MDNRENSSVDIKEPNQASIAQKEKEQPYEDASVQEHEKMCGALEKGNEQEATDVEALPLLLDSHLENGLQNTDLNAVSSQVGRQLENRRSDTDSDALSAQLEEQLVISETVKKNIELQKENKKLRTKGETATTHSINLQIENDKLKKEIKELEQTIKGLQDSENTEEDEEDGRKQEDAAENISKQLPSVSRKVLDIHRKYRNPFDCPASCVYSAAFFILMVIARKRLCSIKFLREIEQQLSNLCHQLLTIVQSGSKGIMSSNLAADVPKSEDMKCSSFLQTLEYLNLIKKMLFRSRSINGAGELDKALQEAAEVMRKQKVFHALIQVVYQQGSGAPNHCMTIRPYHDKSNPAVCVDVYDPQNGSLWPEKDKYYESVKKIFIYQIENEVAKEFTAKCEFDLCKEEHRVATRSFQATGVLDGFFDECEFWDDFYKQLKK